MSRSEEWLRQGANALAGALFVFVVFSGAPMHPVTAYSGPSPSWTGRVTALSTLGLLLVGVIAGIIAYKQLMDFKGNERLKRTLALVDKLFATVGNLPSPNDAMMSLLEMPAYDESLEGQTPEVLTEYSRKLAIYYIGLSNYFDEAADMDKRQLIERDYFLSRHGNVVKTAIGLFGKWKDVVPERYYEAALVESLEEMLKDYKGAVAPVDYSAL